MSVEIHWAPARFVLEEDQLRGLISCSSDGFQRLSDEFLSDVSKLKNGKKYLFSSIPVPAPSRSRKHTADSDTGERHQRLKLVAQESEEGTAEQVCKDVEEGNVEKGREEGTGEEVCKDVEKGRGGRGGRGAVERGAMEKAVEEISARCLEMSKSHGQTLNRLERLEHYFSIHQHYFSIYQHLGTSRLGAAYALMEFGLDTATRYLQTVVAKDLLKDKDTHRFQQTFHQGYIEDVDYCRAALWAFNAHNVSLATYWSQRGYSGSPLCDSWEDVPKKSQLVSKDLLTWLREADKNLADDVGVDAKNLSRCLRLYATAVRHSRNRDSHLFSLYEQRTRSVSNKSGEMPKHWRESQSRLKSAMRTLTKSFCLSELRTKWQVTQDIMDNIHSLAGAARNFFITHSVEVVGIARTFLAKLPLATAVSVLTVVRSGIGALGTSPMWIHQNWVYIKYHEVTPVRTFRFHTSVKETDDMFWNKWEEQVHSGEWQVSERVWELIIQLDECTINDAAPTSNYEVDWVDDY